MDNNKKTLKWLGIVLILAVGIIHVIEVPESFHEAAYKGWLFYFNGLGAVLAAAGIYLRRQWGWHLGMVIAVGSLIGYIASRTVGLPLIPAEPDAWLEPMGVASLIVEGLYIFLFPKGIKVH